MMMKVEILTVVKKAMFSVRVKMMMMTTRKNFFFYPSTTERNVQSANVLKDSQ